MNLLNRLDGWINAITGLGTWRDKTQAGRFCSVVRLTDEELTDLYDGDSMAARIVDTPPRHMLRQGFLLRDQDPKLVKSVESEVKRLCVRAKLEEGWIWGRLYGRAVIVIGADDGQADTRLPLNEQAIRSLDFLDVYDNRDIYPHSFETNPKAPGYREPNIYRIVVDDGRESYYHVSRLILCRGAKTARRQRRSMNWADYSVLQRPYDVLRKFWQNHGAADSMMSDASQAVIRIKGLFAQIAAGNLSLLETRAHLMNTTRSVSRAVLLDADYNEDLKYVERTFAGVPDMLSRSALLLSAVSRIPVTLLMGQAPAGLNATGDSDIRNFYDELQPVREQDLRPDLERIIRLICLALKARSVPSVEFPPLWQETPAEQADRELKEAQADAARIQTQVLTPEEVAIARFGGDKPARPKIDPATRIQPPEMAPEMIPGALDQPPELPGV